MSIYGPISISQFGLITLCILCHQEALVSSFPPSKEENIRAWCAFPVQDMPEVVKKKVTYNSDSLTDQRVGYLLGYYSKKIHTQTRVKNEYPYNRRTSSAACLFFTFVIACKVYPFLQRTKKFSIVSRRFVFCLVA